MHEIANTLSTTVHQCLQCSRTFLTLDTLRHHLHDVHASSLAASGGQVVLGCTVRECYFVTTMITDLATHYTSVRQILLNHYFRI
jgi:hypothetical protein